VISARLVGQHIGRHRNASSAQHFGTAPSHARIWVTQSNHDAGHTC
jgi:hypothetical protein